MRDGVDVSFVTSGFGDIARTRSMLESAYRSAPDDKTWEILLLSPEPDVHLPWDCHMRVILHKGKRGWLHVCNRGAQAASGHYLIFINPMLELLGRWLDPLLEPLAADENIALSGGRLILPDSGGIGPLRINRLRLPIPEAIAKGELVAQASCSGLTSDFLVCRRDEFLSLKGYDARFPQILAEMELCRKFATKGKSCRFVPEACALLGNAPERSEPHPMQIREFHRRWWNELRQDDFLPANQPPAVQRPSFAIRLDIINGNNGELVEIKAAEGLAGVLACSGHACQISYRNDPPACADVTVNINTAARTGGDTLNILWLLSWPTHEPRSLFRGQDMICVASEQYARAFTRMLGVPVRYLPAAPDVRLFPDSAPRREYAPRPPSEIGTHRGFAEAAEALLQHVRGLAG